MKYGVDVPPFGKYSDPRVMAEVAYEAEQAGWDGFFTWDHLWLGSSDPFVDPWVALAAIAMRTERIRIGAMITPLARRRPWQLARTTVSLDHLSNGRLIFGVGLGDPSGPEFGVFGMETDAKVRAKKLDEGLDVLTGLWSGEPFSHEGEHFQIDNVTFQPTAVQQPRIPIWVAGQWPNKAPMRRAARWDGAFPIIDNGQIPVTPHVLTDIRSVIDSHRTSTEPFDIVTNSSNPMGDRSELAERAAALEQVGLTWVISTFMDSVGTFDECRAKIRQGPPR